jgi:ParB family chromosome partitioning protein
MATKKARLGRGLDALLGAAPEPGEQGGPVGEELRQLPVGLLQRGRYQPRTHMDEEALADLAASIRAQGVVQPILVRETATGRYEIVAGERRWRAAELAGLATVPAVVRPIPDEMAMAVALIENIQREDLNPIEQAAGLKRLMEEFGMTHQQVAERIGRSRTGVTNLLRLLSLPPAVREHLEAGRIDMGHARALLALPGERQVEAAEIIMHRRLSVRQAEQLVRRLLAGDGRAQRNAAEPAARDADVARLEQELSERLGAAVNIQHGRRRGRVVIEYHSLDELDGILSRIH